MNVQNVSGLNVIMNALKTDTLCRSRQLRLHACTQLSALEQEFLESMRFQSNYSTV